jgi:hypothetical protein
MPPSGGSLALGTPVLAFDCLDGPNQQFEFYGLTVYTMGGQRCLDVDNAGTAPGTKVQSFICNGTVAQQWTYDELYNVEKTRKKVIWNTTNGNKFYLTYGIIADRNIVRSRFTPRKENKEISIDDGSTLIEIVVPSSQ